MFALMGYFFLKYFDRESNKKINPDYLTGLKYLLNDESDKAIDTVTILSFFNLQYVLSSCQPTKYFVFLEIKLLEIHFSRIYQIVFYLY